MPPAHSFLIFMSVATWHKIHILMTQGTNSDLKVACVVEDQNLQVSLIRTWNLTAILSMKWLCSISGPAVVLCNGLWNCQMDDSWLHCTWRPWWLYDLKNLKI